MESYSISYLIGTPHLDEMELEQEAADDRRAALECDRAEADFEAARCGALSLPWSDGEDDPEPPTTPAGAMFPAIFRWSDDVLIVAIAEADARHPGMMLHANPFHPDRHEAFVAAATAELLRRLGRRSAGRVSARCAGSSAAAPRRGRRRPTCGPPGSRCRRRPPRPSAGRRCPGGGARSAWAASCRWC